MGQVTPPARRDSASALASGAVTNAPHDENEIDLEIDLYLDGIADHITHQDEHASLFAVPQVRVRVAVRVGGRARLRVRVKGEGVGVGVGDGEYISVRKAVSK